MAATKVLGLLKKGWQVFVDPEAEQRIEEASSKVRAALKKYRQKFRLSGFRKHLDVFDEDIPEICRRVYLTYVERVWDDLILTDKEEHTLGWISTSLELDPKTRHKLHVEYGKEVFARQLGQATADGVITEEECATLERTAEWMELSVRDLMQVFFVDEGEGFLHNVFVTAIEDGTQFYRSWDNFTSSAEKLGFTRHEALSLVMPHAMRFIEHVLADAKADMRLDENERDSLNWLLKTFLLPREFVDYVNSEVDQLALFTQIAVGELPSLEDPGLVELRAGEIVHFYSACMFHRVRNLKSGPRIDEHEGDLVITDNRLIFSSLTKPFVASLRRILSVDYGPRFIDLRATTSTTGKFLLGDSTVLGGMILETAVRRANQKIVAKASGEVDRHIPREVRQRVWQRYGGRCVDCGAGQYLEFDHIIPIAKGGSNSDNNIQLLCRKCNLAKRDLI